MRDVDSIEELVAGGERDLKMLADSGNTIALLWLTRIHNAPTALAKLTVFSDIKVALMSSREGDALILKETLFPEPFL